MDAGTLYQLRKLINRRNVTADPTSRVSAWENFSLHVVEIHVMSACMAEFKMTSVDADPSPAIFTPSSAKDDTLHRRRVLLDAIQKVLDKHVKFSLQEHESTGEQEDRTEKDYVQEYMHVRCSLLGCCTWSLVMLLGKETENGSYDVGATCFCYLKQQTAETMQ